MSKTFKGLSRLGLLILFPIAILLTLHFFGENKLEVDSLGSLDGCIEVKHTSVILRGIDLQVPEQNQVTRIERTLERKNLVLISSREQCLGDSTAVYLVDKEKILRGAYNLEQGDVNRLFVELDIVLMNDNYGESISR